MCAASPSAAAARLARGSFGRRQSRDWLGARDAAGGGAEWSTPQDWGVAGAGTRARALCPEPWPEPAEPRRLPASTGLSGAAPLAALPEAGAQSRSPHPWPKPPTQVRDARGRRQAGAVRPLPPFSPDSFDPRALRRTSAPGLPGSARGGPGNGPQLISFHQAALGRLETAEPVIAFFRRPCADWTTANQRLVYTR
ncbi:hypothetical protein mRhiFer1_009006 [Rhinolophus ferrumequinum]|uniref:Uncharacterized protein n=1 Tax=Rhinolophus ferrumequinum TaxID=59479 RepID=A0A7J7TEM0_RHIFE|nr:hypothetical protein mRhiFer1_009006 [Rhinolophus ferrumequinum]